MGKTQILSQMQTLRSAKIITNTIINNWKIYFIAYLFEFESANVKHKSGYSLRCQTTSDDYLVKWPQLTSDDYLVKWPQLTSGSLASSRGVGRFFWIRRGWSWGIGHARSALGLALRMSSRAWKVRCPPGGPSLARSDPMSLSASTGETMQEVISQPAALLQWSSNSDSAFKQLSSQVLLLQDCVTFDIKSDILYHQVWVWLTIIHLGGHAHLWCQKRQIF